MRRQFLRVPALLGCAALAPAASAYQATADVVFTWATDGLTVGWTSNGVNSLPFPSNDLEFRSAGGSNSVNYYNPDFAVASDYGAGTDDDCLTPLPNYEQVTLRKYACRHSDTVYDPNYGAYSPDFQAVPVTGFGPGAAAAGQLTVTDVTMTGTLAVISTTDEPTGATTTFIGSVRTSNSAGNGADGYNIRTADGSPFGNAWYGVTTMAQLIVNLTGTFTQQYWAVNGGSVTFSDPGFACQQGGFGGSGAGTLCTPTATGGQFTPAGGQLGWGMDPDGAATGATLAAPIEVRDSTGTNVISRLGGVLGLFVIDGAGNLTTDQGEFRSASGSSGGGCPTSLRWGGDTDPGAGYSEGISCGVLSTGSLVVTGVVTPGGGGDDVPDPFSFADVADVALSTVTVSGAVTITGIDTSAAISVSGGSYSIGCTGSFTTVAGFVVAGDTVCVAHTSAPTFLGTQDTVLTVGTVSDTFTSTTVGCDIAGGEFVFTDQVDVEPSSTIVSSSLTVTGTGCGVPAQAPISIAGDPSSQYSINGGSFTSAAGTVTIGDVVVVRHTSAATPSTATNSVLTIGGVSDTFTSTTRAADGPPASGDLDVTAGQNGLVDLFSATFDGALAPCTGTSPAYCAFFGGEPTASRNVQFSPDPSGLAAGVPVGIAPVPAAGSRLNLVADAGRTSVTLAGGTVTLPDLTLTLQGATTVAVQGAGLVLDPAPVVAPLDALGRAEFLVNRAPSLAADFSSLSNVVTGCTGPLCALVPILTFDMVRYRLVVDFSADFTTFTAHFIGQTPNNSMLMLQLDSTPAAGGARTQAVYGSMANAVNGCFNIAVSLTGTDCSYARTRVPQLATPSGPKFVSGFYAQGSVGDDINHVPAPGDGKLALPLSGTVTIDDNGTPANGADDRIGAEWAFGPGVHNASTGNGDRALERWDEWIQVMAPTAVSAATPLAGGGFEYVIGSRGKPTPNPLCAAADPLDCFPSENAPLTQTPPGYWDTSGSLAMPSFARTGIERSPGFGLYPANPGPSPNPNVGAQTVGSFSGYECIDNLGDNDCVGSEVLLGSGSVQYRNENGTVAAHPTLGNCADGIDNDGDGATDAGPGTPDSQCVPVAVTQPTTPPPTPVRVSPPGFDNVVLVLRTNAAGDITAAQAYWTREYLIASGPAIGSDLTGAYDTDNSWNGGRFTFAGTPGGGPPPQANPDAATVQASEAVTIDVLDNDTGLAEEPVTVAIYSGAGAGIATVLGDSTIRYESTVDYATSDTFFYQVADGLGRTSVGRVDVTVTEPPGPRANDDAFYTFGDQPEAWPVLRNDQRLYALPMTVDIVRAPADGTAVVHDGGAGTDSITVTYTSASRDPVGDDSYEYRVTDADGYSDVATVRITRYPNMAQDDVLVVSSGETGALYPLSNDYLPWEPPLYGTFSAGVYVNPQHGTVRVFDSPGYPYGIRFEYTPYPGYTGEDSFEYAVDNERRFSIGTVRVTVVADADRDGVVDGEDNCTLKANPDQRDTDGDGYGNVCDADLNNSGFVNMTDLGLFRQKFGTNDPHADFNGSGFVNYADLGILSVGFGKPPGPSGTAP